VRFTVVQATQHCSYTFCFKSQLAEQVVPIQTKKKKKELEKQRMRCLAIEEEQGYQSTLSMFDSDTKSLRTLTKQIDTYLESNKPQELEHISSKVAEIFGVIEARKGELVQLEPSLDALKRAVEDQERHKKLLKQNIDILEAGERMPILENEIESLFDKRAKIEGHSAVYNEYKTAKERKEELQQKKANYDGRFASHVEQIRALKVCMFLGRITCVRALNFPYTDRFVTCSENFHLKSTKTLMSNIALRLSNNLLLRLLRMISRNMGTLSIR
jgi:hypothetical protein